MGWLLICRNCGAKRSERGSDTTPTAANFPRARFRPLWNNDSTANYMLANAPCAASHPLSETKDHSYQFSSSSGILTPAWRRRRRRRRKVTMNVFRLAADMTHLLSIMVLLLKIRTTKSCSGKVSLCSVYFDPSQFLCCSKWQWRGRLDIFCCLF